MWKCKTFCRNLLSHVAPALVELVDPQDVNSGQTVPFPNDNRGVRDGNDSFWSSCSKGSSADLNNGNEKKRIIQEIRIQLIKHGLISRPFCPSLPSVVHNRGVVIRSVEIICVLLFEVQGKIWLQRKSQSESDYINLNQSIVISIDSYVDWCCPSWFWCTGRGRSWCVHGRNPVRAEFRAGWCHDSRSHTSAVTAPACLRYDLAKRRSW